MTVQELESTPDYPLSKSSREDDNSECFPTTFPRKYQSDVIHGKVLQKLIPVHSSANGLEWR